MSLLRFGLLLLALGAVVPAWARVPLPEVVGEAAPWQLRGSGEMRFLGWRVYEAALWQAGDAEALAIRYDRAISGERLVSTTLDEMLRLGIREPSRWREALEKAFPDVTPGDVLVARRAEGRIQFYEGERRTASIDDGEFADAFFAIWLDPRTREPDLRAALLGQERR
jgi:hypothetical protein